GFPGTVHARHGGRLLHPLIEEDVRGRIAVDESADDRNGADGDDTEKGYRIRRGSDDSELLVRDFHGTARRFRRCLPDELVAGGKPSQTWHDDCATCRRQSRSARSRYGSRYDRDVAHTARYVPDADVNGRGQSALAIGACDGSAVILGA